MMPSHFNRNLVDSLKKAINWESSFQFFSWVVKRVWFWVILSVLLAMLVVLTFFIFWEWLDKNETITATIRNIVLVIAAIIGLPLAIWRILVAQRQSETAQRSFLNERHQKGVEMLFSDVLSVRLGGIYALQSLTSEHAGRYHVQIMRIFCAFLRDPKYCNYDESIDGETDSIQPRIDVQAVMDAIAARDENSVILEQDAGYVIDLRNLTLSRGSLERANLSNTRLSLANLQGTAFRRADLSGTILNGTDLTGADLGGAKLHDARLNGAILQSAVFWTPWPPGPPRFISYHSALQEGVVISADLSSSQFDHTNFRGASLQGVDLSNSKLTGCNLAEANLSHAILNGANLSGAKFSENGNLPATGLTQTQIENAWAEPNNSPILNGVTDAKTGQPLVWSG